MIDVDVAEQLLDFGARKALPPLRAREQLEGAVALHNLLQKQGVAYLADEVGMGKTLVALGVVALFRHFNPRFRVLVIAPRENIQLKWAKEMRTFVARNVRVSDMRVRSIAGTPARPLVHASNLFELLREAAIDGERDFFARLTSFSLPLGGQEESWHRLRDNLREHLPWLKDEALDLRGVKQRKDNFARALCCALPQFDLVIVDEAHNLKHGFKDDSAARNRVLAIAFGHPSGAADRKLFANYGPRATRVLFLSATPVDENYRQLWNQLDVFGRGADFEDLARDEIDEEAKKRVAGRFLIRRVTAMRVVDQELTKNQYRRHWNRGGVELHDDPVRLEGDRQKLTVALVQKKVSELLGSERFGNRFQIGMLASFESFLETTKLKRGEEEASNFDDADQADGRDEREGIDVRDLNLLARSHLKRFGREMPHPKMDSLVARLRSAFDSGEKALVFVRRVASVKELKYKLDEAYDDWLHARLIAELPLELRVRFNELFKRYQGEKLEERTAGSADDLPLADTFFAWFFRGEGPRGVISGANVQQRFTQAGTAISTFFDDNYVADLLDVRPGNVFRTLADRVGMSEADLAKTLQQRSLRFIGKGKKVPRRTRFEAVQAAAVEVLNSTPGLWSERARVIWEERFRGLHRPGTIEPPPLTEYLETSTFFTELRQHPLLRNVLWPVSTSPDPREVFREAELRAQLLARTARLGHAFIDFYVLMMSRIRSFELKSLEEAGESDEERDRIDAYIELLESQRALAETGQGAWRAFHELRDTAAHFDLIVDVNIPQSRHDSLLDVPREIGELLGTQQPIGGMSGQVNQRLVKQFRMPGYPFVLVTTDLLQEGEDLHTFCSTVYHYGISWTPSAMEQRIGRIDRVGSHTERRLTRAMATPHGDHLLQVYFPHLEDTVEVLQVRRVLDRMNTFLRLMHKGLADAPRDERQLDVAREIIAEPRAFEQVVTRLHSAFPVLPGLLRGTKKRIATDLELVSTVVARFAALRVGELGGISVDWEENAPEGALIGTARLPGRQQPFALYLRTYGDRLVIRCLSPVGKVGTRDKAEQIKRRARELEARVGAIMDEDRSYDLTIEEDVLLGPPAFDRERVAQMVARVVLHADQLEQQFLPGLDQALGVFETDLEAEHVARDS